MIVEKNKLRAAMRFAFRLSTSKLISLDFYLDENSDSKKFRQALTDHASFEFTWL